MDLSVLVVDDEENLLVLLNRVLSKEDYEVKTATNAYEALDFVDEGDIGVAIVDVIRSTVLRSWRKSKNGLHQPK